MTRARLCLLLLCFGLLAAPLAAAELRLATWHVDLSRDGPGLLLRDLAAGKLGTVVAEIAAAKPDVLLLTDIDYDAGLAALGALAALLREDGLDLTHLFALRPNAGMATGRDLDDDGRLGGPRDAEGYGEFSGQGGMALLSRLPLGEVRDFSDLAWAAQPDNLMLENDPGGAAQRLSSSGHWVVPLLTDSGALTLLAWCATPPVFDGPEDRNGRRNRDELMLWHSYLEGAFGPPATRFVLIGDANLDPTRGDGRHEAIQQMLADPRLNDPLPGEPTAFWDSTGPMRVSYILPSRGVVIADAGIRPRMEEMQHALVFVDLALP